MNRVIVSLTTIPARTKLLPAVLASLHNQTYKPDVIYLQIPLMTKKGATYNMNEIQNTISSYPRVVINRPNTDVGPITKFIPILDLESNPNTWIILVDDDMIYDSRMIEKLMDPTFQHILAIGFAGRNKQLQFKYNLKTVSQDVVFLETFGGVRYQRSLFPVTSNEFMSFVESCLMKHPACANTDDIILGKWISARTSIYIIPFPDNKCVTHSQVNNTPQLRNNNLGINGNNKTCYQNLYGGGSSGHILAWLLVAALFFIFCWIYQKKLVT